MRPQAWGAILNLGRMTVSGVMRANSAAAGGAMANSGRAGSDAWASITGTLIEDNVAHRAAASTAPIGRVPGGRDDADRCHAAQKPRGVWRGIVMRWARR